jgi:hypothetical protein
MTEPDWLHDENLDKPKSEKTKLLDGNGKWIKDRESINIKSNSHISNFRYIENIEDSDKCCGRLFDPVIFWFRLLHIISLIGCTLAASMNLYIIYKNLGLNREICLRFFSIIFCFIIFCVEIDWIYIIKRLQVFDIWFFRGLTCIFIGILSIDGHFSFERYHNIIGFFEICIGSIYIILFLMCIRDYETQRLKLFNSDNTDV